MMVRGSTWRPVAGGANPKAPRRACRPRAMGMPMANPRTEPPRPTTSASPSIDRVTCERLAPTARSSASSRVRCPIRMLNVLAIRKAPTKRAINAKVSRKVLMIPTNWFT